MDWAQSKYTGLISPAVGGPVLLVLDCVLLKLTSSTIVLNLKVKYNNSTLYY